MTQQQSGGRVALNVEKKRHSPNSVVLGAKKECEKLIECQGLGTQISTETHPKLLVRNSDTDRT